MNKSKQVWQKLFSPPCPNCGSTKTKEELRDIPVITRGDQLFKLKVREWKGQPIKPTRTWTCLDCECVFDDKGSSLSFKK